MSERIINLQSWLQTPAGQALCDWEQIQMDEWVADAFGYHALQLGLPQFDALRTNRMPQRWYADLVVDDLHNSEFKRDLITDPIALPFFEASLDLLVLPHTLERSQDAHASLREAARVLVPEGRVVITGLNPNGLWTGWQNRVAKNPLRLPGTQELISPGRLRDWLKLLGFEIESVRYGVWRPAVSNPSTFERLRWLDALGQRYWPIFGAAYGICAVKRVRGMKKIKPTWRSAPTSSRTGAPLPVAPRAQQKNSTQLL